MQDQQPLHTGHALREAVVEDGGGLLVNWEMSTPYFAEAAT